MEALPHGRHQFGGCFEPRAGWHESIARYKAPTRYPLTEASSRRDWFRPGRALARTPCELASEIHTLSARARGNMDAQDTSGRKRWDRQFGDCDGEDMSIAFDGQLALRDEMADQAVVRRIARRSCGITRALCFRFRAQFVRSARKLVQARPAQRHDRMHSDHRGEQCMSGEPGHREPVSAYSASTSWIETNAGHNRIRKPLDHAAERRSDRRVVFAV